MLILLVWQEGQTPVAEDCCSIYIVIFLHERLSVVHILHHSRCDKQGIEFITNECSVCCTAITFSSSVQMTWYSFVMVLCSL